MKKTICILIATLLTATAFCKNADVLAKEGDELYRQGNYTEAILSYEEALAQGRGNAVLYYNLGNAYYRDDQMAQAILNYNRALRLKPGMHDAKENLELARSKTGDRIDVLPRLFIVRWGDALISGITPTAWRTIFLVLLALTAAAVVTVVVGRQLGLRRGALATATVTGILMLASLALLIASTVRYNAHAEAVVMQESVSVKGSPEVQSVDKMILHSGTEVHISDALQGWVKITTADGTSGWCPVETIERI